MHFSRFNLANNISNGQGIFDSLPVSSPREDKQIEDFATIKKLEGKQQEDLHDIRMQIEKLNLRKLETEVELAELKLKVFKIEKNFD